VDHSGVHRNAVVDDLVFQTNVTERVATTPRQRQVNAATEYRLLLPDVCNNNNDNNIINNNNSDNAPCQRYMNSPSQHLLRGESISLTKKNLKNLGFYNPFLQPV